MSRTSEEKPLKLTDLLIITEAKWLQQTQICLDHYSHHKIRKQVHTRRPATECKLRSYMSERGRERPLFHYTQHTVQWTGRSARGRHSSGVGSTGGAEGCRVPLLLATKRSGMGRNAQPCGKVQLPWCITEKKLCDNYSALRYRLNNLSS